MIDKAIRKADKISKNPIGKPRYFKTPKEMESAVEEYFLSCSIIDENPTITGLVLALGFAHRKALLDYGGYSEEYRNIITRAKLLVQESYEQALFNRDTARGAQFALSAGFGWAETQNINVKEAGLVAIIDADKVMDPPMTLRKKEDK